MIGAALTVSWGFNESKDADVIFASSASSNEHGLIARAANALARLPLSFVENRGQTAAEVSYVLQTRKGNVYFTPQEVVFQFVIPQDGDKAKRDLFPSGNQDQGGWSQAILRLQFQGARRDIKVRALAESPARFSYFRGSDPEKWISGAPAYEKLLYPDLYPEIDLLVSGQAGKLKNEYIVRPGGDPSAIAIRFLGAKGLEINPRGQLRIHISSGTITEDAPECYQEIGGRRVPVGASYRIEEGHTVRIDVGAYQKDAELIIDPVIYSTFLGGSESDYGLAMDVDLIGNVYVASITSSNDFSVTAGAYATTYNGGAYDIVVSKLNSSLSALLYSTYLGGSGNEAAWGLGLGLVVDDSGNAYITGNTDSTDFPTTPGAFRTAPIGLYDAFVAKINTAGTALVFSTYLGGTDHDRGYVIATDDTGSLVAVGGETRSPDFPTTSGAYDTILNGLADGFLVVLNSSGTGLVYSSFFGGTGDDSIRGFGADDNGYIYFVGNTNSPDLPVTPGAYDTTFNGGSADGYIAKMAPSLTSLAYLTYFGGSGDDLVYAMEVDEDTGEVYVAGRTASTNFPVTFGAFDTTYSGGTFDAFVTKINAAGSSLLYSTYLGGSGSDGVYDIVGESERSAVVVGFTDSANFPTTSDGTDRIHDGSHDVFVTRLSRQGTGLVFSTFLGGGGADVGMQIRSADYGNYLIFGYTGSGTFPATPGAYDTSWNGKADCFVLMMSIPLEIVVNITPGDFDGDGADEAAVDFGALGAWLWDGGSWTLLTAVDPEGMIAGNEDGGADDEIVADMGALGLWLWNGGVWTQLSGVNVGGLEAADVDGSGDDEVIGDFSTIGLWLWNGGVWTQLSGVDADRVYAGDLDGDTEEEIVVDFSIVGLWLWDSGVWTQLSGVDADRVCLAETDGSAGKEMAVDFGATGLWLWNSGVWTQLSGVNAENIVSGDVDGSGDDEIAVDFGDTGLWLWNGGAWTQISNLNAIQMIFADTDGNGDDELIVDFGYLGLWMYDGGSWSQISSLVAEFLIAADVDGNGDDEILADFGDQGLWLWNGGAWTQLSAADPD